MTYKRKRTAKQRSYASKKRYRGMGTGGPDGAPTPSSTTIRPATGISYPRGWYPTKVFRMRQILDSSVTSSTSTFTAAAYSITLQGLDQVGTFTALFDSYRLVRVTATFIPQVTECYTLASAIGVPIYTVIDYDNAGTPSSVGYMRQYDTCLETSPYKEFTRRWVPRAALAAYGASAFTSYGMAPLGNWFDCTSTNVAYYGIKYFIPVCVSQQTWNIKFEADWEFKSTI